MIGAAMKKIDWKNLSYDDFTVVCPVFRRALARDL